MRVFIDTNVLIDFVCQRDKFAEPATRLMALGCMGKVKLLASALSYITAMYVAHKYDYKNVKESLIAISGFVEVLDLKSSAVIDMLHSDWKDYEDATQYQTAISSNADCIVTRNGQDFQSSDIMVRTPQEFLEQI